ncbi:hypothetical protein Syun_016602 [Stephania yunnanensis]|uniref:Uncharacterized protein n=1 Tax=Stephania yunnanensis TaxID=152371 RepID=A0AAP0J6C4_9MAGN
MFGYAILKCQQNDNRCDDLKYENLILNILVVHKTSKSNKEHGKKSSSKKYGKKKAYQALTTERNDSMRSYGNEAHDTTIPRSTQERCSINQAGVMKHEFIPRLQRIEDRVTELPTCWNSKSSGSDLGDGSGKHATMSETLKLRKPNPDDLGYADSVSVEEVGGILGLSCSFCLCRAMMAERGPIKSGGSLIEWELVPLIAHIPVTIPAII